MYQKVTQGAEGQLLAWYQVQSKYEGSEPDFDVLQDYSVYPHANSSYIAEYLPTGMAYGAFATLEEALETILNKVNDKKKLENTLQEAGAKFQEVVGASSLDGRYANVVVEKKQKTNEQLKEKYSVARMNTTARLNRDYYARLLDH